MNHPGLGVMIGMLGGNEETVTSIKNSLGKKIKKVLIDNNALDFYFEDDTKLHIFDNGQSCCENRYMRTDDDLTEYADAVLLDFELKTADNIKNENDDYYSEEHEVQFLDVKTDKGIFTVSNHNEHNGYYGGFWIVATH